MTDGPLFVIGCPRSGTTLLLDLLAGTGAFGYVSTSGTRDDAARARHGRTRVYDLPVVGDPLRRHRRSVVGAAARLGPLGPAVRRRLPVAIEPWEFWEELLPGFRPETGDGPPGDPPPHVVDDPDVDRARAAVADLLGAQRRDVLLSKYTDFPRIDLMLRVFPAARFVHIRRDPFAVANSYAAEIESGRFGTWERRDWWASGWPPSAVDHWHSRGTTRLGFAAHNRNRLVGLVDEAVVAAGDAAITVGYDELAADPVVVLERALRLAGVEARTDLAALARSRRIASTDDRWRTRRTDDEAALLDEVFDPEAPWPVPENRALP